MAAQVKAKVFHAQLVPTTSSTGQVSEESLASVQANLNAFMAGFIATDILDIQTGFFPSGKYGLGTNITLTVVYLE